jgi:hypothetical protein
MSNQVRNHFSVLALLVAAGSATGCSDAAPHTSDVNPSSAKVQSAQTKASSGGERSARESRHDDDWCGDRGLAATFLGRYETQLSDLESSGETAALKRNRLFVTSAQAVALDVVDVSNVAAPRLMTRVDLSSYGPSIQSVDVSSRGLVAVAVAAAKKTDPGTVVLLDEQGILLKSVAVGSLPDMVKFTSNGRKLVVVNEGEPDCYGAGCTDPEGTVSIVDVHPLRKNPEVRTVGFANVVLPAGVRIFGPGATQAQDIEPEYVTILDDDRTAYVTLQENNAIAVIDLQAATVLEVRSLGYKDFSAPAKTTTFELEQLPSIGATAAGQELTLGGFSGLFFEGKTNEGKLHFVTVTDRGPNGESLGGQRPFLLPQFTPRIVRLVVDPHIGQVKIVEQIKLKHGDGTPMTGLPNTAVAGGTGNAAHNDEIPIDLFGNVLPLDRTGGDFEGVVVAPDGTFWVCDEYRPAIYHFDAAGILLARLIPIGSHAAAGLAVPAAGTAGELGLEVLPSVLGQRRQNRGFEAIAQQGGKLYAFVQSPLRNPTSVSNSTLNDLRNVRLVEVDTTTFATRQFLYAMDNATAVNTDDTRADKIGDMTALPDGGFMVVERDDDSAPADPPETIAKKVYAFSLKGATDITSLDMVYGDKSLDQMTSSELSAVGVKPIAKVLHTDLVQAGYSSVQKVEGLAFIDATTFAVINDNDFGVAAIDIDLATGTFAHADGYQPDPVVLGIVKSQGLDASDKDNVVNIRNWNVYGMYQPDAVANFTAGGRSYLVTANEGDARDYSGFAEEVRVKSIAASYSNVPGASDDLQLGRLTVTSVPPAGDLSRPYVFGTRSFSIWDTATGAQIWDSGAEFESITAGFAPAFFNSNNSSNDFDTRSDNKGPEPEGVATGRIGGRTYAFVGLERIGGVMVYDVTAPAVPRFVKYLNTRSFEGSVVGPESGPEVVRFVPKQDSPIHHPMLVVSNEISGTVTLWGLETE